MGTRIDGSGHSGSNAWLVCVLFFLAFVFFHAWLTVETIDVQLGVTTANGHFLLTVRGAKGYVHGRAANWVHGFICGLTDLSTRATMSGPWTYPFSTHG